MKITHVALVLWFSAYSVLPASGYAASACFADPVVYSTGFEPTDIVVGDLNMVALITHAVDR